MTRTYKAILNGDHLDWVGEAPRARDEVEVEVVMHEVSPDPVMSASGSPALSTEERGRRMAAALRAAAAGGGIPSIPDPVAWEREIRAGQHLL